MAASEWTRVTAVVLAAGCSRRTAPANKLLLPFRGRPLIAWAVDAALASRAISVVVVTGYQAEEVRQALGGRSVIWAHNPDYGTGMAGSLRIGLAAVPDRAQAAVICLGDMPGVGYRLLDRLIDAYGSGDTGSIIVPMVGGQRGNPVLWDRRYFTEMATLTGDKGARQMIESHADAVVAVSLEQSGADAVAAISDVDTFAAFGAVQEVGFDNNST